MSRTVAVTWRDNNTELFECDSFRVEGNFIYFYVDREEGGEKKLRTIITSDLVKSITAVPEEKKVKKVKKIKKVKKVSREK